MLFKKNTRITQSDMDPIIEKLRSGNLTSDLDDVVARLKTMGTSAFPLLFQAIVDGRITASHVGYVLHSFGRTGGQALVTALGSSDLRLRTAAASALATYDWSEQIKVVSPAIPLLITALSDSSAPLRKEAAGALGPIASTSQQAIDALTKALSDPDQEVRLCVISSLQIIGTKARSAVPFLLPLAEHPDPQIRRYVLQALCGIQPGMSTLPALLMKALQDPIEEVRTSALQSLTPQLWQPDMARTLETLLKGAGPVTKGEVLKAAIKLKDKAGSLVDLISTLSADPNKRVADKALDALWSVTGDAARVIPLVRTCIRMRGGCDQSLCDVIAKMGPEASPFVESLAQALTTGSYDLRWAAASALAQIGPGAEGAIVPLISSLAHPSSLVASVSATALAQIGPRALPGLLEALDSGDVRSREYAQDALGQMGELAGTSVSKLLRSMLSSSVETERNWAAIALGEISGLKEVVPRLISCLNAPEEQTSLRAAKALGKIGKGARAAIPALEAMAASTSPRRAREAEAALRLIKPLS